MLNKVRTVSALCGMLVVTSIAAQQPMMEVPHGIRSNDSSYVAFTHATVTVSPGRTIDDATLLVRNGRVVSVKAGGTVPAGAREIDLTDFSIFPGFVDPISDYGLGHLKDKAEGGGRRGFGGSPQYDASTRQGANAWNEAIRAEADWVTSFKPDAKAAEGFWKQGFTAVQSNKLDGIFRGRGFVASTADGLSNEALLKTDGLHFAAFDKGSSSQSYPTSLMGSIALVRQTLMDADWYARAHEAFGKNPDQAKPETNLALAALGANRGPVVFETNDVLSMLRAGRIASEFNLDFIYVGDGSEYIRIDEVKALGGSIVLPVHMPDTPEVASFEDALDVSLSDLRHWERASSNAAVLAENGVDISFTLHGLDSKDDFLGNVRKMVEAGLPADKALAAMTTVPASMIGIGELAGSLEPGKRADFLITDGDLITGDAKIHSVWIAGQEAKQFESLAPVDYRGDYLVSLPDGDYWLSVDGEPGDPSAKVRLGEETWEAKSIQSSPSRLSFQVDREGLGIVRVSFFRLEGLLQGRVTLPDGQVFAARGESGELPEEFTAVPEEESDEENGAESMAETEGGEESAYEEATMTDDVGFKSRLTLPNTSFGFSALPTQQNVLITNATLWTNETDGILETADIAIRNGKISAIGTGLSASDDAMVIDGTGLHVTPGMIDEHSHLASSGGLNEGSHSVTAEVRVGDVIDPTDIGIYRAVAGGTTTAQVLHGSSNPIGGQAQVIKHRWGATSEGMKFDAAPPSIKFALGENVKRSNSDDETRYPQTRMGVDALMRDVFQAAREYEGARARFDALPRATKATTVPPRRDIQLETMAEILNSERFVHCHSYVQQEILALIRLADEFGFKVQTFTHILEGYKVAPEMAAHGAGGSTFSDWWAYKFEVYDSIPQNTCLMQDAGVTVSINSDSDDLVRRLNQEAAKSVLHCDMSQEDALKLATLNPAIQLKIDDRVGSLKVGKDADIVLWNGNPLSVMSRPEKTWIDGALYFSRDADAAMRVADSAERQALIQKVLASGGDKEKKKDGGPKGWPKFGEDRLHCDDVVDVWKIGASR